MRSFFSTNVRALALLVLGAASWQPLWAWGNTGHEAVAYIAWQQMNPQTRTRAIQILKLIPTLHSPDNTKSVPGYAEFVSELPPGLSQDEQDLYVFMRAATWPDTIKHQWLRDSDTPPANSGPSDAIIGYTDNASHGYWHFIDVGLASDNSQPADTPVPNAVKQILVLRTAIASTDGSDDVLKSYELVWLEHLVGDVHQPLHAAARFYANQSDAGGNAVKIQLSAAMKKQFMGTLGKSAPAELHAFWDSLPGEGQPAAALPFAVAFAKALPPAQEGVDDTDPNDWAAESLALAKKDAYRKPIGKGPTPANGCCYKITQAYYNTAMKDAKSRIPLAGARLAKLLNDNLH
ncbi:MAG TPA: S1/P1 nuclease [Bryobacteraceae bacterium]|nr:S1/P1 nuclease [Bryobacteraceae bacterium]